MAAGISMTAGATDRPGEPVVRQGTGWSAVGSAIGPSAGSRARRRRATSSSEATTGSEIRRTVHIGYERSGSPRPTLAVGDGLGYGALRITLECSVSSSRRLGCHATCPPRAIGPCYTMRVASVDLR
jgi:hypothetical protein